MLEKKVKLYINYTIGEYISDITKHKRIYISSCSQNNNTIKDYLLQHGDDNALIELSYPSYIIKDGKFEKVNNLNIQIDCGDNTDIKIIEL